jgi:SHS family lactate transporter-like MFS transporter
MTAPMIANALPTYTRAQRTAIVVLAFAGTVLDGADFTVFLFFMAPLAAHLHVSLVALSGIQASSYLIGIIGGIAFGRFADRRGRRLGLFATILVFSVFTVATATVDSYALLFVMRVLAGIGIGGESGIAFAYVNEAFPGRDQRRGLASGLLQSMFLVGAWVAAWIYRITAGIGEDAWRWAFASLGIAGLICAAATFFMPESRLWRERMLAAPDASGSSHNAGLRALLSGPLGKRTLIACALLATSFYGSYAVYTYGPAMWQSVYHLSPSQVGNIGMVSAVLGALSYITGGFLADAIGRRRAYMATALLGVVAYAVFAVALFVTRGSDGGEHTLWIVLPAYFLLQMGYGYFGVQGVWLSELFPTEVRTTAQNAVYYIGRAVGAGGAPIVGLLLARHLGLNVAAAVAFGAVGAIGAAILCRFLPETRGMELQR